MKLLFLLFTAASGTLLKTFQKSSNVNDEISVGGQVIAKGDGVRHLIDQCAPLTKPFTEAKVCGCNYRLHVMLTADCNAKESGFGGRYATTVGDCDCTKEGCREGHWEAGYSDTFTWKANSYKVEQCTKVR